MRNLKDRVFIVTGGASGMGRELIFELLNKGAQVCAVDINAKNLEETVKIANVDPKRISSHVVDISDPEHVGSLPEKVVAHHGKIDGLFNNAGIIQPMTNFENLSAEFIQKICKVNTFSVFNLTRACLPYIKESDQGFIINTSSMGGFLPVPGQSLYGASKSAVKLFTEALYAELYDTNINVHVVFPGAIQTNIMENSGVTSNMDASSSKIKMTSANDAAKIIIKGVEKEKLRILVGKDAKLMDKMYRFFPVRAIKLMQKMLASVAEQH